MKIISASINLNKINKSKLIKGKEEREKNTKKKKKK